MKKENIISILLIFFSVFLICVSFSKSYADSSDLFYRTPTWELWKKSSSDTLPGTLVFTWVQVWQFSICKPTASAALVFSATTGRSYYKDLTSSSSAIELFSDGNRAWKAVFNNDCSRVYFSLFDSGQNWNIFYASTSSIPFTLAQITAVTTNWQNETITISPDWTKMLYWHNSGGNRLMQKSISNTLPGDDMLWIPVGVQEFVYSKDWTKIYYGNSWMYERSSTYWGAGSIWTKITNYSWEGTATITSDWKYLIYSNSNVSYECFKRDLSVSWISDGSSITPLVTCYNPQAWYPWTYINQGCFSKIYNTYSSNKYDFMTLTWWTTVVTLSWQEYSFDNYSSNSLNEDYFQLLLPRWDSPIFTWSLNVSSWWTTSVIKTREDSLMTGIHIFSMREWQYRKINYVRFHTTANTLWVPLIGSQIQNYVWEAKFINGIDNRTVPLTFSWNYVTAITSWYWDKEISIWKIVASFSFDWFEIWYSTWTLEKLNCWNGAYSCSWIQNNANSITCEPSLNPSWTPQWACEVVWNKCTPTSTQWNYDWFTSSGSSLIPIISDSWETVGLTVEDTQNVFSCNIRDGLDWVWDALKCPFTILWNIWEKLLQLLKSTLDFISKMTTIWKDSYDPENVLWFFLIEKAYANISPFSWSWIPVQPWQKSSTWVVYNEVANNSGTNAVVKAFMWAGDNLRNMNNWIGGLVKFLQLWILFFWFVIVIFVLISAWGGKK